MALWICVTLASSTHHGEGWTTGIARSAVLHYLGFLALSGSAGEATFHFVACSPWWAVAADVGFGQGCLHKLAVSRRLVLSAPILVLAGRGGEGNDLGITETWDVGGDSGSMKVRSGEYSVAAAACCHDLWSA